MTDQTDRISPDLTRRNSVPVQPVVLADGQLWGLALPTRRYAPAVVHEVDPLGRSSTTTRLVARLGYPWPVEHLIGELREACRSEADAAGDRRRFEALMNLADALLRRAHSLSRDDAVKLLDLHDDRLIALVDAVLIAVAGTATESLSEPAHTSTGGGYACPA